MNIKDLGRGCTYYRPSYRAQQNDKTIEQFFSVMWWYCSTTRLGCKGCDEYICEKCWKIYKHKL